MSSSADNITSPSMNLTVGHESQEEISTVLLVDDDLGSLIMGEEVLDEAGLRVLTAENGLEAIEICKEHKPDIIIMDVVMPKMNGYDACLSIRQSDWGEYIPILMVTGLEDIESINQAYEVGATDFLTKPVNFFVLPHRVKYMLRSKKTADELRSSQELLDHAQRIAQLGHWEWTRDTDKTVWSHACRYVLPVEKIPENSSHADLVDLVHEEDREALLESFSTAVEEVKHFNVEFRIRHSSGELKVVRQQAEPQCDTNGRCVSMLGTIQDVTERHNTQQQIHSLAYYDHVTGLPNRALLHDRLDTVLKRSKRTDTMFAVLFLDLDRFKLVNDTLGHDAGDDLLSQVSTRLSQTLRESDLIVRIQNEPELHDNHTIARLGGDEFVVLIPQISKGEDAARCAKRIAHRIAESYEIMGSVVNISTTIGISIYPNDGSDGETLLKNADIAMYHAKKKGRNGFQFYSDEIHQNAQIRFALEQDLRKAIEEEQFRLVYQPKLRSLDGAIVGVEALIRWEHPEQGPISPEEFITLAEETELIIPLGEWIMETACTQLKTWHEMGFVDLHMAVNCSSIQLMRADIPGLLTSVLHRTGLEPHFLEIELTESLLLDDTERGIEILEDLRSTGIMTSIDDFGTGFSSMSYLKRLPIHKLKIDQSFVREIGDNKSDSAIVSAILTLAKNLQLGVVAEGVETQEQLDFLVENQCDEIQGYLLSRPLEADDFVPWYLEDLCNKSLKSA